ncbi:uncharacterized protein [Apostichopus japonicus]|uniref:uncharacterized protein n=1 Tax=Stichopus japonicus TaxID=307972 RepID=UPI003AB31E7D
MNRLFAFSSLFWGLLTLCRIGHSIEGGDDCRPRPKRSLSIDDYECVRCFACDGCNSTKGIPTVECETRCFKDIDSFGNVNRGCINDSSIVCDSCQRNECRYCCSANECNYATAVHFSTSTIIIVLLAGMLQMLILL